MMKIQLLPTPETWRLLFIRFLLSVELSDAKCVESALVHADYGFPTCNRVHLLSRFFFTIEWFVVACVAHL